MILTEEEFEDELIEILDYGKDISDLKKIIAHDKALRAALKSWEDHPVRCNNCLKPVEKERYCYVKPVCYECLPPPPELDVIEV